MSPELEDRIMPEPNSGCWLWVGARTTRGYGSICVDGKTQRAHRHIFEQLRGEIPAGLVLDHLCRTTCCVNPAHLDPVTQGENHRRGRSGEEQKAKTHCPAGHEYTLENTLIKVTARNGNPYRRCRTCRDEQHREYLARKQHKEVF